MTTIGFGRHTFSFAYFVCNKMYRLITGGLSAYRYLDVKAALKMAVRYCTLIDMKKNHLGPLRHLKVAIISKIQMSAIS
jgi:hypothetical protein